MIQPTTRTSSALSQNRIEASSSESKSESKAPTFQAAGAAESALQTIEARKKSSALDVLPGRESDPAMRALFGSADAPTIFDAASLYDASGVPKDSDVCQDAIGDCYFVSTLAALADRQPKRIQDAIRYDEKTQTFHVTLHQPDIRWAPFSDSRKVEIPVTQKDLEYNIERRGGSTVDNDGEGPIWPAVMETAFAKLFDQDWSDLKQGFDKISGGFPSAAMFTLTGKSGKVIVLHEPTGPFGMEKPGASRLVAENAYQKVSKALAKNQPVTLAARKEYNDLLKPILGSAGDQDGLRDFHVYQVKDIYKDVKGEVFVKVRNPWATNEKVGEGRDTKDAVIDVKLRTVIELGMLGSASINIGPAME